MRLRSTDVVSVWKELAAKRWSFVIAFGLVFGMTFSILNTVGFVPENPDTYVRSTEGGRVLAAEGKEPTVVLESSTGKEILGNDSAPRRVVVESVGIDVTIENPESRDIGVLDRALLSGAVHYPGSGTLADTSNMFIFGHSSYLPRVNNESFRAFNDLQKVQAGDVIRIESSDTANIYRVQKLELVSADEALVELGGSEKKLTLSTCNSFGNWTDRYVVEAEFVRSERL